MSATEENFKEQLAKLLTPGNADTTFECPTEFEFYSESLVNDIHNISDDNVPIITTTGQTLSKGALDQYNDHPLSPGRALTPNDKCTPNRLLQQILACLLTTLKRMPKNPTPTLESLVKAAAPELTELLQDSISKQLLQAEQGIVVFIGTNGQVFNQATIDDPQYKEEINQYLAPFKLNLEIVDRDKGIVKNLAVLDLVSKINAILFRKPISTLEKADALFNHGNYQQALSMYITAQFNEQPNQDPAVNMLLSAIYLHQIGKCYGARAKHEEAMNYYVPIKESLESELLAGNFRNDLNIIIRYLQICCSLEHAQRTLGYKGTGSAFGDAQTECERVITIVKKRVPPELLQNPAIQFEISTLYEGQLYALKKMIPSKKDSEMTLDEKDTSIALLNQQENYLREFDKLTQEGENKHCQDPYVLLKRAQYYAYLASLDKKPEDKARQLERIRLSAVFCRRVLSGNRLQELPVGLQQKTYVQYGIALINEAKYFKIPSGLTIEEYSAQAQNKELKESLISLQEKVRDADHACVVVLHQDPNQRTAILNQSMALFWLGDFEKAARVCRQRLRVAPDDVPIKLNLINALLRLVAMPNLDFVQRQEYLNEAKNLLNGIKQPKNPGEEQELYNFLVQRCYPEGCPSFVSSSTTNVNILSGMATSLSSSMGRGPLQMTSALLPKEENLHIFELGITLKQFNQDYKGQYQIKLQETSGYSSSLRNTFVIQDVMGNSVGELSLNNGMLAGHPNSQKTQDFFDRLYSQPAAQNFANTR